MHTLHTDDTTLDALASGLLQTGSPLLFATAGRHLSEVLVRGQAELSAAAERLLDAMEARLSEVRRAMVHQRHEPLRISLSTAAATVALARPDTAPRMVRAMNGFLHSVGPAAWTADPSLVSERALLSLILDDAETAARCVEAVLDTGDDRLTPWLYRWTLAHLHGIDAPAAVRGWSALQALARRVDDAPAGLLVVSALAIRLRSTAALPASAPARPVEAAALN